MTCDLCGCQLVEKNDKPYGKPGSEYHISRHHYFPKRLRKFFNDDDEIKEWFGINNVNGKTTLCYFCHEELIHNLVLSPKIIKN